MNYQHSCGELPCFASHSVTFGKSPYFGLYYSLETSISSALQAFCEETVTNRDSTGLFRRLPRPLPPNSDIFTRTPTRYQNNACCGN